MIAFDGLARAWGWGIRKALRRWVRPTVKPEDAARAIAGLSRPVCYVLETKSRTDLAVLSNVCRQLRLPSPDRRLALGGRRVERACFDLAAQKVRRAPRCLQRLLATAAADADFDVDLVPVAIFWGRAPQKEVSWWRLLFADDWTLVGRFGKLLHVIFNGRSTLVYFGEPIGVRQALEEGLDEARAVRRILRSLRSGLRAQRASTIGPDLSHRRTMVTHLLRTAAVRRAVRLEMQGLAERGRPVKRRAALLVARKHALEIAANYSHPFVTFMSVALGRLWNWLYDGVDFEHVNHLDNIADGTEIIYVPCHRSHMDYLLLSYVIYRKGFALPHIAAGANLNMPGIGRWLRKGGAFFLRRSFKGDALYAVVFMRYLEFMMSRGHPLEYFIEGGRSRTGRLLPPRTGMLSMSVRSYLHSPKRPVIFMPVYFGYERIVEGGTYIGELSGRPKEKESVFGLIKAFVSVLRLKFGRVHVNLGAPIALDDILRRHNPGWRDPDEAADSPGWVRDAVDELALRILVEINSAAAVTPVNLVAMAMLGTAHRSLPETVLIRQLELYQRLLKAVPYSPLVTVTEATGAAMIRYVESMGVLERQPHALGDIMRMSERSAVLATYYRNNCLHLFAMPSLIACGFIGNAQMSTLDLQRLVWRVYPYIAAELFLRWEESSIGAVVDTQLDAFVALGLLQVNEDRTLWQRPPPTSVEAIRLSLLAQATIETLERYYLVVALLLQAGSGKVGQAILEERCHLMAQRMSVLYGLDSPEFFDKSLFRNFIDLLRSRNVVQNSTDGCLLYGDALHAVAADAQLVLSEQIRHSILQVTLAE